MRIEEVIEYLKWLQGTYDAEFTMQDEIFQDAAFGSSFLGDEDEGEGEVAGEAAWIAEHNSGQLDNVIEILEGLL